MRDYEFNQELQESQSEAAKTLQSTADAKRSQLEQWSSTAYGEVRAIELNESAYERLLYRHLACTIMKFRTRSGNR